MARRPKIQGGGMEVGLAQTTSDALTAAERYAKGMQDDYVSTEHILLASPIRWRANGSLLWPDQGCDIDRAQVGARLAARHLADPESTYQSLEKWDAT